MIDHFTKYSEEEEEEEEPKRACYSLTKSTKERKGTLFKCLVVLALQH